MTPDTLRWLHWLVSQQTINVGAADAPDMLTAARRALADIEDALNQQET